MSAEQDAVRWHALAERAIKIERAPEANSLSPRDVYHAVAWAVGNESRTYAERVLLGALIEIYRVGYAEGSAYADRAANASHSAALDAAQRAFNTAIAIARSRQRAAAEDEQ